MFGIIVNPVSGGGEGKKLAQRIAGVLEQRGCEYRIFETQCENDGGDEAKLAISSGCDSVVCIGGDGTLSEVVCGMAGSGALLYIVPGGTGNDFARVLHLPKDPVEAFCAQLDGERTKIDCGRINGKPFINVAGSGFDVEVLRKMDEFKQIYPGGKAYRKAVLAVLGSYKAFEAEVSVDEGPFQPVSGTIIEIANGRYIGGGMLVAPSADYRCGQFDVVFVDKVPRRLIPFLLPLFILGLHVHLPICRVVRARKIVMRSPGMVVNIDGRLEEMDEACFEIVPGALDVCLPKKA